MALGGGTFLVQNRVLNGTYINFISVKKASANLSDRGYVTMPLELDWGVEGKVFTVTQSDFVKNSVKIFGYPYADDKMQSLRELFLHANVLYAYRLNGGGTKASNTYATALYGGTRGNALSIAIRTNAEDDEKFDVVTLLDTTEVDKQTVADASELVANDFVTFNTSASLSLTASTPLTGGTNTSADSADHQSYLDAIESYSFNVMGVDTADEATKNLYVTFVKNMRENVGAKFQLVVPNKLADYEGVISVENTTVEGNTKLVYWVAGAEASCPVNKSLLNTKYDGELTINASYTQLQLEAFMKEGRFAFHLVNGAPRVLADINTFVTPTEEKRVDLFSENQTIRVIDQIANDIAVLFNEKYLGIVPNDASGRISLWNDIVKHHEQLANIRAIQNFSDSDVIVEQGDAKNSVLVTDNIEVVNAMAKLYMNCYIA